MQANAKDLKLEGTWKETVDHTTKLPNGSLVVKSVATTIVKADGSYKNSGLMTVQINAPGAPDLLTFTYWENGKREVKGKQMISSVSACGVTPLDKYTEEQTAPGMKMAGFSELVVKIAIEAPPATGEILVTSKDLYDVVFPAGVSLLRLSCVRVK
jgi:hypothetical protein